MRVTLLQTDIRWAKPEENIDEAERLMLQADDLTNNFKVSNVRFILNI